ncbi:unnamed protein product [Soboliphyme baturini]|uniref:Secreted protein n=1 Tax=Soboliphyme baturini TaxID=241478 RepID=A0A183IIR6_9BILA|nr:unnamed protein product [Soboliphyme baturini]
MPAMSHLAANLSKSAKMEFQKMPMKKERVATPLLIGIFVVVPTIFVSRCCAAPFPPPHWGWHKAMRRFLSRFFRGLGNPSDDRAGKIFDDGDAMRGKWLSYMKTLPGSAILLSRPGFGPVTADIT